MSSNVKPEKALSTVPYYCPLCGVEGLHHHPYNNSRECLACHNMFQIGVIPNPKFDQIVEEETNEQRQSDGIGSHSASPESRGHGTDSESEQEGEGGAVHPSQLDIDSDLGEAKSRRAKPKKG